MFVNVAALDFHQRKHIPTSCPVWLHQYVANHPHAYRLHASLHAWSAIEAVEESCAFWHVSASKLKRVHEEAAHVGPCVVVAWVSARILGVLGGCAVERVMSLHIDGKIKHRSFHGSGDAPQSPSKGSITAGNRRNVSVKQLLLCSQPFTQSALRGG